VIDRLNSGWLVLSFVSQAVALAVITMCTRCVLIAACALFGFRSQSDHAAVADRQREFDPRSFGVLDQLIRHHQITMRSPGVVGFCVISREAFEPFYGALGWS